MNLVLIGLRGSGKSTVGRAVAALLGRTFVDLDEAVAGLTGHATVAGAFRALGEPAFRALEVRALGDALAATNQVLALGGGTPTAPGAADLLRAGRYAGELRVVYLAAPAGELRSRLERTDISLRPSLTGADPLAEIETVLDQRDGLYRDLADAVICTRGLSVEQAAAQVADTARSA